MKWKSPSNRVGIELSAAGGLVSGERLQQAIEVEAKKNDNRRKLVASGCDERHLFVYVDRRNYLALVDGNVPKKVRPSRTRSHTFGQ
jgi:hypothetical protein